MSSEWVNNVFDTNNDLYETIFVPSPDVTEKEVDFLVDFLDLKDSDHILDTCCGSGRHVGALSRRGYKATGIDISPQSIIKAQQLHPLLPSDRFITGDVRIYGFESPDLNSSFDVALNIFSSFGYYDDDAEQIALLRGIKSLLKPEGKLFLDLPNKDFILKYFKGEVDYRLDDYNVHLERKLSAYGSRLYTFATVTNDSEVSNLEIAMNIYSLEEMRQMLTQVGFSVEKVAANYSGADFTQSGDNQNMLLLCKKEG